MPRARHRRDAAARPAGRRERGAPLARTDAVNNSRRSVRAGRLIASNSVAHFVALPLAKGIIRTGVVCAVRGTNHCVCGLAQSYVVMSVPGSNAGLGTRHHQSSARSRLTRRSDAT